MSGKLAGVYAAICMVLLFAPVVLSQSSPPIPAEKSKVNAWFDSIIKPLKERGGSLDPELAEAEAEPKIIKVSTDGGGDFKTVTKAIESVPVGNKKRVIISIGPGVYKEKIKIEKDKPFITLLGDRENKPNLTFDGDAKEFGTVDSATLIVMSNYFMAVYINFVNSSPRPQGELNGAQAVALRLSGDKAALYDCSIFGFQDTLCDDRGNHFFKNCQIQGTVDFIFGSGKSLYLDTELYVIADPGLTVITAQARVSSTEDTGYSFVHCKVTGTAKNTYLGRAWKSHPRVIFAYSEMTKVVIPAGWSHGKYPERAKTVYYGEYKCTGEGVAPSEREPFTKALTEKEALPFLTLDYIGATKWLLPPSTDLSKKEAVPEERPL